MSASSPPPDSDSEQSQTAASAAIALHLEGQSVNGVDDIIHLRGDGVSLVMDCRGDTLPRIVHWGGDLGLIGRLELEQLVVATRPQVEDGSATVPQRVSMLPENSTAWLGTPGITGHRGGRHFSTAYYSTSITTSSEKFEGAPVSSSVEIHAEDASAGLELQLSVQLLAGGLVRSQATVTNVMRGAFTVDAFNLVLPVPEQAVEILDFSGRYARERTGLRRPFLPGTHLRENRRSRIHDGTLLLTAGTLGFGFRQGEVWSVHVAWSGNTRMFAEQVMPTGLKVLGGGELLLSGEVRLERGQSYSSPWVYGSYGSGLDQMSGRFHDFLRARPGHVHLPRPVLINVWEAVYFHHNLDQLCELARLAAEAGVERYVLDDGWFRNRRSDKAGLGDWYVDDTVWPDGLEPLIRCVHDLGMDFGLWVEPEMISPDSDLARAHPDWILHVGDRLPPTARNQQVLDLTNPAAWGYLLERLDALLTEYPIAFIKWDHNRDLIEAGGSNGRPAVHDQTHAVYRLIDELRALHPGVEFESCAGGGGRIDLGILERVERVWPSDSIDALERQTIEANTRLLVPPEMTGSHIGAPTSHTSGRTHPLGFRAATAFFGQLGIEWDLASATDAERGDLAEWIRLHKEYRTLVHTGTVINSDHPDPAIRVHGVVSADQNHAVVAIVQLAGSLYSPPGRVRIPGLREELSYEVSVIAPRPAEGANADSWFDDGVVLSGRSLNIVGVQAPVQFPERTTLLRVSAIVTDN